MARALESYKQALAILREVGDRPGEATALRNVGFAHNQLGEWQQALQFYGLALPICRDIENQACEAATRYDIAMIHREQGQLDWAVAELEQVVELKRQLGQPDLESVIAALERVRQEQARSDVRSTDP